MEDSVTPKELSQTPLQNPLQCPYNTRVIETPPMITDTAQDAQIRRSILKSIESMDLEMLKRIAYECRCEELGIRPDMTYYTNWN